MAQKRGRKQVMVPGSLLPTPQPGKFHGTITSTKLCEEAGQQVATVSLSDEKIKLQIRWSEVQQYLLQEPGGPKKKRRQSAATSSAASAGTNLARPPLAATRGTAKTGSELPASQSATRSLYVGLPSRDDATGNLEGQVVLEKAKAPPDPKRYGLLLQSRILIMSASCSTRWALGTKLWLKLRGYSPWPVLMWSAKICQKKDTEQLLATYKPGMLLVRFYGEHSSMWVRETELEDFDMEDSSKFHMLKAWGRQHNKPGLVNTVLEEVENAIEDADGEVERLLEIEKQSLAGAGNTVECSQCQEEGATAACLECERAFHTLCMQPPALKATDLPNGTWTCPFCGNCNQVGAGCTEEEKELTVERMGLTPDWIIQAAAFDVFQLEPPTPDRPYIKGLLDPCTNSMAAPNIPAEVLYDKQMNGLKLSNSWAGHVILLNPPYTAATQWRFVNRAIDEVENDQVPAVLLLCRNSTDTAYFQRLRPYPRVLLRRTNTRFKDYSKTPIGFGICVFAIAKSSCRELYSRFYEAFADMGEPNIPIDKTIMRTDAFHELLDRLRLHAEEHYRDHWIQCSICTKWRIITYESMLAAKDADWTCRQLRPPFTSCRTPQTKREVLGGRYAALGADGDLMDVAAERVDYSIPRLDLPQKPFAAAPVNVAEAEESATPASSAARDLAFDRMPESVASCEAIEKFVKLPARPVITRATQEVPQVLSAIELARQARIAANRAYLAGLRMGTTAMAQGAVQPVPADNALVLAAARKLAEKAAVAEAKSQVEQAKRHWAKTSTSCAKEAEKLSAAMEANTEELCSAQAYLQDAESAFASLQAQQAAKLAPKVAVQHPPTRGELQSDADSEEIESEGLPEDCSSGDCQNGISTRSLPQASAKEPGNKSSLLSLLPAHTVSAAVHTGAARSVPGHGCGPDLECRATAPLIAGPRRHWFASQQSWPSTPQTAAQVSAAAPPGPGFGRPMGSVSPQLPVLNHSADLTGQILHAHGPWRLPSGLETAQQVRGSSLQQRLYQPGLILPAQPSHQAASEAGISSTSPHQSCMLLSPLLQGTSCLASSACCGGLPGSAEATLPSLAGLGHKSRSSGLASLLSKALGGQAGAAHEDAGHQA